MDPAALSKEIARQRLSVFFRSMLCSVVHMGAVQMRSDEGIMPAVRKT